MPTGLPRSGVFCYALQMRKLSNKKMKRKGNSKNPMKKRRQPYKAMRAYANLEMLQCNVPFENRLLSESHRKAS